MRYHGSSLRAGAVRASLLVILIAAGPWACRSPGPAGRDWHAVEERTRSRLSHAQYDSLRELVPVFLEETPSPRQFPAFSRALLNTAAGLRRGPAGDPYPLIRRLDALASDAGLPDSSTRPAWLGLASEYLILHLPWRASAALSRIPAPLRPGEIALRDSIDAALATSAPANAPPGAGHGAPRRGGTREILARILAMPAFVQPFRDDRDAEGEAMDKFLAPPQGDPFLGAGLPTRTDPLLLPLLSSRRAPVEEDPTSELDAFSRQSPPLGPVAALYARTRPFRGWLADGSLDPDARSLLRRLASVVDGQATVESVVREADVLLVQFVAGGGNVSADSSTDLPLPGSNAVLVAFEDRRQRLSAWLFQSEGPVEAELRDLTGDHDPELVLSSRNGSGGFLSVEVLDLAANRTLWRSPALYHGEVLFLNADRDAASEILAVRRGLGGCGQCPAPLEGTVVDYDSTRGRFEPVSRRHTVGSYYSGTPPFGMGPHMFLRLMDRRAQTLLSRTPAQLSRDDFAFILGRYFSTLMEAEEYGRAENSMRALVRRLQQTHTPTANRARAFASRNLLHATLLGRGAHQALALSQDPALKAAIAGDSAVMVDYQNLSSLAAIASGNLDQAYRALSDENRLGDSGSVFQGNLSWYYREVGAYAQAHDAAALALDRALAERNGTGIIIDMVHLSVTAYRLGRVDEAVDWSARAVGLARGLGAPSQGALALTAAADLAIEEGEPTVALQLLDEALICADAGGWLTLHSSILLLYGKALEQLGMPQAAANAYRVGATPEGQGRSSSAEAAALFQLSRLADRQGDRAAALSSAREAFDAMIRGRQTIGVELHKFSFVATQNIITEWLLRSSAKPPASPRALLEILERSKMQVFLDLHPGGPRRSSGITDELLHALGPGELVLDYWVGDSISFVISASAASGITVHPLGITGTEAGRLVEEVRGHMDLKRPGALASIRRDRPPAALIATLGRLHSSLIPPAAIPPGTRTLVIVPDGHLLGLPWSALVDSGRRPLIGRYEVTVVPSLQIELAALTRRDRERGGGKAVIVAALGAVTRDRVQDAVGFARAEGVSALPLAPLRHGMQEALSVGRAVAPLRPRYLFDRATLRRRPRGIQGGLATPGAIHAAASGATIVHVIAHGVFNDRAPMQSALFVQGDSGNGRITAEDLAGYRLERAELVALSACQTGVSRAMPGAEQIGFVRGVLGSGAASVVLTEWEVDDAATADFYGAFYASLRTSTKSGAVRSAQRSMMRRFRHPFYWAGITLYGDWHRLPPSEPQP